VHSKIIIIDSIPIAIESNFSILFKYKKSMVANNKKDTQMKGRNFLIKFLGIIKKIKKQIKENSITVKEENKITKAELFMLCR
jgi:hypothetical protein